MLTAVALLFILPTLVTSSGDGNIHLLEDEVATALRSCTNNESLDSKRHDGKYRKRRSDYNFQTQFGNEIPRIDDGSKQDRINQYGHERRNSSLQNMYVLNGTKKATRKPCFNKTDVSVEYVTAFIPSSYAFNNCTSNLTRSKRSETLISISEKNQCLSQCVFANLQVVDVRGIPLEIELWNKLQTTVTSQQSRTLLKDQIRACFQELQSDLEAEEDSCAYSSKLERCLMLQFSERKAIKSKTDIILHLPKSLKRALDFLNH